MAGRQLSDRNEGSPTLGSTRTGVSQQGLAAGSLAAITFACYYATLLPGLDLGDSASFQTGVGSLTLTPRQAYPLYYALGNVFVWLIGGEPARAMNLASAVYGALAVGVATGLSWRLSASSLAGIASGLFLGFSYTFWSQSVTSEVYTLHLLLVGSAMYALLVWADRPSLPRLAVFFAVYALAFGNHLSTILLLPAFAIFLLVHRRTGDFDLLRPKVIALAGCLALLGALQYSWNLRGLWVSLEPPSSFMEGLAKFWFDVTKADWRETLVMNVSEEGLKHRPAMYWFDLRQQFGVPGVLLAGLGSAYVTLRSWRCGVMLAAAFLANLAFAWTYNVGDAYIFFLPSHYVLALWAGAGVAAIVWALTRVSDRNAAVAAGLLCLIYPAWRGYDAFPAVDRSSDSRATRLVDALTSPMRTTPTIYGLDANWQLQNAFEYFMREHKPGVPWFTTDEFAWLREGAAAERFDTFVRSNADIGRDVVVTPRLLRNVGLSGRLPDDDADANHFIAQLRTVAPGTPYVFSLLRPDREFPLAERAVAEVWRVLTGEAMMPRFGSYTVLVGNVGSAPAHIKSSDRPYRTNLVLGPLHIDVRMESWLPTDTIRRAGFGHAIVNRHHFLTLERGMSFAAIAPNSLPVYGASLFASVPRQPVTASR